MGRPAHRPDATSRRQVEAMTAYGVPELNIASVIGIDPKTLRKHYRDELDNGQVKATAKVAESLFRKATSDGPQSVTAAIFWLKTKGGWRETPQDHRVGLYDLSKITEEELDRKIEAAQASIAALEHRAQR
jgi:hypothetical protein